MIASKYIKIDPEMWEAIRDQAKGYETPNAVLRRMFGLSPWTVKRGPKAGTKKIKKK